MAKGHPKVGWAPIGFAVAAPCTNLPEGIVLGIVLAIVLGYRFRVGPYRFLQQWQPHDPLNTTLVIPNFCPILMYIYIYISIYLHHMIEGTPAADVFITSENHWSCQGAGRLRKAGVWFHTPLTPNLKTFESTRES